MKLESCFTQGFFARQIFRHVDDDVVVEQGLVSVV